eukprot:scaffold80_cov106-Isochrysis_galbana.AAC.5
MARTSNTSCLIKSCGVTGCHCVRRQTLQDEVSLRSVASMAVSAAATDVPEGAHAAGSAHSAQTAPPECATAGECATRALTAPLERDPSWRERLRSLKQLSMVSCKDKLWRLRLPLIFQSSVAVAAAAASPGAERRSVERRQPMLAVLLELSVDAAAASPGAERRSVERRRFMLPELLEPSAAAAAGPGGGATGRRERGWDASAAEAADLAVGVSIASSAPDGLSAAGPPAHLCTSELRRRNEMPVRAAGRPEHVHLPRVRCEQHDVAVDGRAAAVAAAEDGRGHVRMGGRVEEGGRVTQPKALIVHLGQTEPVCELDADGLAAEDEVPNRVVEACGEGAGRGVLGDGAPTDDVQPGQLLHQLVPERGGMTPVEEDALKPRGRLAGQLPDEGRGRRQVDPAVGQLEGQRAHEGVA